MFVGLYHVDEEGHSSSKLIGELKVENCSKGLGLNCRFLQVGYTSLYLRSDVRFIFWFNEFNLLIGLR